MEVPVIATIAGTGIATIGVGVTIIVLLIRGSYALGRSTAQVESLSATVADVRNEVVGAVRTEVGETRAEARQDNQHLRTEVKQDIQDLRTDLKQDIQHLQEEIRDARAEAREDNRQIGSEMVAGFETLTTAINALRAEIQQSNQMIAALATHTHDTDGRTTFTVPPPPNR